MNVWMSASDWIRRSGATKVTETAKKNKPETDKTIKNLQIEIT